MSYKIMIVDDAFFMRLMLKRIVEQKAGWEVVGEATNGLEALEKYKELKDAGKKPDIITMDITMPQMDGLEALAEFQKLDNSVPIVMCSSLAAQKIVIQAIRAGASDFIIKPFEDEELVINTIKKVLGEN